MKNQEHWDKIEELESDLAIARRSLLQNNNWRNTSNTPGSYWMWEKELKIGKVLTDEDTALRIQGNLDSEIYSDMEKSSDD